ncbi:MAG: HAD family hydrolase [Cellvibrionaceae bacterium]
MQKHSLELVIFDCDGVLVDSEPLAAEQLATHLAKLGVEDVESFTERCRGLSMVTGIALIEAEIGGPLPQEFLENLQRDTYASFEKSLKPVRGIEKVLGQLQRWDIPCCVASSGSHEKMSVTLGVTQLGAWFDGRIFSAVDDDVARGKPAPDLFLYSAKQMGVKPENCIVVEDSVPGVQAAVAAGMRVIGFSEQTPAGVLRAAGAEVAGSMAMVHSIIECEMS